MNVAFIPVRGGSKSIPLKNIKMINGKPLVYWTVKAAVDCKELGKVFVSTDSLEIKKEVESFGFNKVQVIGRNPETATDEASTESVMLEFASNYEFDVIALIQATNPLLVSEDLEHGFSLFQEEEVDSVLSVVRQKRFHWQTDANGFANPVNYDIYARPRREEFSGYLVENGAFYITAKEKLLSSGNRISGNIRAVEMDESSYYEIDEPDDFVVIEAIMRNRERNLAKKDFSEIKMFLTDCDGCLTDGGMYYSETGNELKKFNAKDGMGFQLLREKGIITGIITGEERELIRRRAEKLNIDILKMGVKDKAATVIGLCREYGVELQEVAYVGDDINDLEVMKLVGYPCCVRDAELNVKAVAKVVSDKNGGDGAVRELIDKVLQK